MISGDNDPRETCTSFDGGCDVAVGDISSGRYEVLHRFDNTQGATSWRRSHPHPAFSHDGRRIYFNVGDGEWTRLFVAERNS